MGKRDGTESRQTGNGQSTIARARFLHEEKRGAPPVLYYRVDFDAIAEAIGRYVENRVPKNDMTQDDMRKTTE